MKKQHTEEQHFVPQLLLKQFSFDGKRVFVLDRKLNKIFTGSVKHLCYENDIYDVKWKDASEQLGQYVLDNIIEDYLADLEKKVAPYIRKLIHEINDGEKGRILSITEKQLFDEFLTTLYIRNPYVLKTIIDYYEGVDKETEVDSLMQAIEYLFDMFKWGSPISLLEFTVKRAAFTKDIAGSPYSVIYESFSKMKYVFWYAKDGGVLTSSFPMHISLWNEEKEKRILFPLSNEIAVVFYDTLPFPLTEGMVLEVDSTILEFNMDMFFMSYSKEMARFFIAKDEQSLKRLL